VQPPAVYSQGCEYIFDDQTTFHLSMECILSNLDGQHRDV